MIKTTCPTRAWSVYYLIFSTTYLSIRGSIPSGCCIFHSGTRLHRIISLKQSNSGAKFVSRVVVTYLFLRFFCVSEMSRDFFGLVIQLDSAKTTGSSFSLTVPSSSRGTWSLRFGSLSLGATRKGYCSFVEYAGNCRSLEY